MKKVITLILVFCMAFVFTACQSGQPSAEQPQDQQTPTDNNQAKSPAPADDGKVYKLNVSFAAPEFSTTGITAALDRIQEASKGRLEFTYYYSWSITSVPTVVDDLNSGIVDIAAVPVNEHINLFPYSNLVTYTPFLGLPGMLEAADIFDELYKENEVLQKEYANAGLFYWTNYPCPGYNIYTTKDYAIKKPADLKGIKLITSSALLQQYITAHGGAAVTAPVTEYATSLNTNVVDGVINHVNVVAAFGCMDFINAATIFGDSGTAMSLMMMCISKNVWEELPADLQQLFMDEAKNLRHDQGEWDKEANTKNISIIADKGGAVTHLTGEEIAVWADAFKDMREAYIKDLIAQGATEAQQIYDKLMEKIAKY
jgi:TRAP-type C4-dicarboxylate transport system substrate-binding protein